MKISINRLKEIILEEVDRATNIGECGTDMEVVSMNSPEGFDDFDGSDEEAEEGDVAGLAARAMAAIHDLAVAAGAEMDTTVNADDQRHDPEEIEIVEDE